MTTLTTSTRTEGRTVRANGIDIHYVEEGQGEPLVLLHGGFVSTGPIWEGTPFAYSTYMDFFAKHFRVIAPDTRGCGRSGRGHQPAVFSTLADDVAALIDVLNLDRPVVCGFSEGGCTASVFGIRHPGAARAIVNHAGYDLLNPGAGIFELGRQMMGGSPEATRADESAFVRFFQQSDEMSGMLALMRQERAANGEPGLGAFLDCAFPRFSTPPGYAFADLARVTAPMLILVGDRDHFCSVEEGIQAYRALPFGEFAVLPNSEHMLTEAAIDASIEFLSRHMG